MCGELPSGCLVIGIRIILVMACEGEQKHLNSGPESAIMSSHAANSL